MGMGREFALGLSFWQLDRAEGMDKAARSGGQSFPQSGLLRLRH